MIRWATQNDVEMLARLHVAAWRETYPGLLPEAEIAARDLPTRRRQWQNILGNGTARVAVLPELGFAAMGPQRDPEFRAAGYPEELLSLYLLAAGHGTGAAQGLVSKVRGTRPFTAAVLDGNARACAFYEKIGGRLLGTRADHLQGIDLLDRVYGFSTGDAPAQES